VKKLESLGPKERAIIEDRRRTGYRKPALERFSGELEPQLRAVIACLLPGVPASIDLASFVDTHADDPLGRGDRERGVPATIDLFRRGLQALACRGFATMDEPEQKGLIGRLRHGDLDDELGLPAKAFIDRLLSKALAGYLAHPVTWERIGFNGPAYPEGYAWIDTRAVVARHRGRPGAGRL
jgi:hypothetical protein